MIVALDTSVILDLLLDDPKFGALSEKALRTARLQGRLIVCEVVVAEVAPAFHSIEEMDQFFGEVGIEFESSVVDSARLAGAMYTRYLKNRGTAKRVLPDFLVAAHAVIQADALLARDRGYYREYFDNLHLIDPSVD